MRTLCAFQWHQEYCERSRRMKLACLRYHVFEWCVELMQVTECSLTTASHVESLVCLVSTTKKPTIKTTLIKRTKDWTDCRGLHLGDLTECCNILIQIMISSSHTFSFTIWNGNVAACSPSLWRMLLCQHGEIVDMDRSRSISLTSWGWALAAAWCMAEASIGGRMFNHRSTFSFTRRINNTTRTTSDKDLVDQLLEQREPEQLVEVGLE